MKPGTECAEYSETERGQLEALRACHHRVSRRQLLTRGGEFFCRSVSRIPPSVGTLRFGLYWFPGRTEDTCRVTFSKNRQRDDPRPYLTFYVRRMAAT